MASILKRVLSRGDIRAAAPPTLHEDEDTLIDTEEPEVEGLDSIQDTMDAGLTNHRDIKKALMLGSEGATFYVGKDATPVAIPKRVAMYHSQVIRYQFRKTRSDTLPLPNIDPAAFYHIAMWMLEDKLDISADYIRTGNATDAEDACTILCRMFIAASHLEITAIQSLILEDLLTVFTMARLAGKPTPVLPSTVMEVWEYDGEGYELWKFVLRELCVAFSSKPMPVFAEYQQCFKTIGPFLEAVVNAMADKIEAVSEGTMREIEAVSEGTMEEIYG